MWLMSRTISGRSVEECLELLQKPPTRVCEKGNKDKYYYIKTRDYAKRLNEVFGSLNYDVSCTEPVLERLPITDRKSDNASGSANGRGTQSNYADVPQQEQLFFTSVCTITVRDDDGTVVCSKSCAGGIEIVYSSKIGRFTNLALEPSNATKAAFREVCKMFCIFGYNTENEPDLKKLFFSSRKGNTSVNANKNTKDNTTSVATQATSKAVPTTAKRYTISKKGICEKHTDSKNNVYYQCKIRIQGAHAGYSDASKPLIVYESSINEAKELFPTAQTFLAVTGENLMPMTVMLTEYNNCYVLSQICTPVTQKGGD